MPDGAVGSCAVAGNRADAAARAEALTGSSLPLSWVAPRRWVSLDRSIIGSARASATPNPAKAGPLARRCRVLATVPETTKPAIGQALPVPP